MQDIEETEAGLMLNCIDNEEKINMDIRNDKRLYKVKKALLCMQRYSWEQGVTMQAFLEAGDEEVVIALAYEAVNRSIDDGRVAMIDETDAVTDPCAAGEALFWCSENTDIPELKEGYQKLLNWALYDAPKNKNGGIYHLLSRKEFWADSMYMLPPFLAVSGHYKESLVNIMEYWKALYSPKEKLMRHIWDDEKAEFNRDKFWGVGNGWTMAGIARVIELLPTSMKQEKKVLVEMVTELINSVLGYRTKDGLFHDILNERNSFVETNLAQMLAYTIYKGIKNKWLSEEMRVEADICRRAVQKKINNNGFVLDVCGAPTFDKPGIAPEGNAFYILMESAAN